MEVIAFSVSNVRRQKIRRRRTWLAGLGRAAGRAALGGWPAPWPAQAGRLWGVAGPLAGPGRAPGRAALGGGRPLGRLPGRAALCALREDPRPGSLLLQRLHFGASYLRGFFPK